MNVNAGRRYIDTDAYRDGRERVRSGYLPPALRDSIEVLSGPELRAALHLRTYADLTSFDIQGIPEVGLLAAATNVVSFVETIPVESLQVELDSELSESALATAVKDGQPLPEGQLNFGTTPQLTPVPRFGVAEPITLGLLDEPGRIESLINSRLTDGVGLGLDNDILNGNALWTGALAAATSAGNTIAKGGGYRINAIVNAVAEVQDNGWYARPLQIVTNPLTRAAVFLETDSSNRPLGISEMLDDQVSAWIPSKFMPVGQALVGDLFSAVALLARGGLEVSMSYEYMDFLVRSMVEMKLETRCTAWVREAGALCLVTGIA